VTPTHTYPTDITAATRRTGPRYRLQLRSIPSPDSTHQVWCITNSIVYAFSKAACDDAYRGEAMLQT